MQKRKVLIIEDSKMTRKSLCDILCPEYDVIEAENGKMALDVLEKFGSGLAAVITDIYMPQLDGYEFIGKLHEKEEYDGIPILVGTCMPTAENEKQALRLGAWDFLAKPYDSEILLFRLKNAIERSELAALRKLKYLAEYDELTGIYNKSKLYLDTSRMLKENPDTTFAFVRYDVDRFKLVNTFYGTAEGDGLLIYMGKTLKKLLSFFEMSTYGRIESDIFGFCVPYDKAKLEELLEQLRYNLGQYNKQCDIVPSFGIYVTKENDREAERLYNYATLASKNVKGSYVEYFSYYNDELSRAIEQEQTVINEMNIALNQGQFDVVLQPKYNVLNGYPCGAEALIRWLHPEKGAISPNSFVPLFEKNGFIAKVDYYVWEKICIMIRKWLDAGKVVYPISVNVSRVNIYNPNIVNIIADLVKKYEVPAELLQLELTESAYIDNPVAIKDIMIKLQKLGFTILMDDFGSGYSSLNMLKDVPVDIIKADMNFLSKTDIAGRGENIMASVIRMSKWLKIPVIVEGVETVEQLNFLRSVGCEYVQGHYFSKPMTVEAYENLISNSDAYSQIQTKTHENFDLDAIFNENPQMELMFSDLMQAMAIYEFDGEKVDIIRVNDRYYDLINENEVIVEFENTIAYVLDEYKEHFLAAFKEVCSTKDKAECIYVRKCKGMKVTWIRLKLKYVHEVSGTHLVIGTLEDVTIQREAYFELERYRAALNEFNQGNYKMLIVDDTKVDRAILSEAFGKNYTILEARDGNEAIEILQRETVDVILLDLVMPYMNGESFLEYRRQHSDIYSIPVVVITSNDDTEEQLKLLTYGINDYIVKPFVMEVVKKRVTNVMEANIRMKEILRRYAQIARLAKIDQMTELYNRMTTIRLIDEVLKGDTESSHALIMLDIDDFKDINDSYGHMAGDSLLSQLANLLKQTFRVNDIIGRMGGDEFVIFMSGVEDAQIALRKCIHFRKRLIENIVIEGKNISCSFGIAMARKDGSTFQNLYEHADSALYEAKKLGKNQCCIYGERIL